MQPQSSIPNVRADLNSILPPITPNGCAISWKAVFAGAVTAGALAFILIMLGVGLGFSTISPWQNEGLSAQTITISSILWLSLTQILACAMGGYLAGRLRVKWDSIHNDEVYFRDTAHGLLVWAVSLLISMTIISGIVGAVLGGVTRLGGAALSGAMHGATVATISSQNNSADNNTNPLGYYVSSLFRSDTPVINDGSIANMEMEATKIFLHDLQTGNLSAENKTYIAKLVAKRTGLNQLDAEKRVENIYAQTDKAIKDAKVKAGELADKARGALAATALWAFVALLLGAFSASLAATWGGKQRDNINHIL